jgi:ubiquinone/menaquinone biosynthesis C-methylase UbiE
VVLPLFYPFLFLKKSRAKKFNRTGIVGAGNLFIKSFFLYSKTVVPLVGRALFGARWPGAYLKSSIEALPSFDRLKGFFSAAGFKNFECRPLWGGIVSLFIGRR